MCCKFCVLESNWARFQLTAIVLEKESQKVNTSQKEELPKNQYVVVDIISGDGNGESSEEVDDDSSVWGGGVADAKEEDTQSSTSNEKKIVEDGFKQLNDVGLFNKK